MARRSATAALLLLVLSLLAVAHCRALAADHDTEPESTAGAEAGASATEEEALPAEQQHGLEFLRLPSSHRLHRHHRPCSLHRHLWWNRHQGGVYHGKRRDAVSHLTAVLPEEAREEAEEVKGVAEPDPDRSLSLPDSDGGEGEQLVATRIELPASFVDHTAGHDDDGERAAAVKAWKKEVLRRWFHFHFHHGMRRHHHLHHHHDDEEEKEKEAAPEGLKNMKRFKFHHHHHDNEEDDKEKNETARKRLRHHAEHDEGSDDEEDEQVEEMVRRFRKAIVRSRRFGHGHGRRYFHHHLHRHAEEANKKLQADGEEESGVMAWIKGLMNRF